MKSIKFNSLRNKTITVYDVCTDNTSNDVLYFYTHDNTYKMHAKNDTAYIRDIVNIDHILNEKILDAYEFNGFYILRTLTGSCAISWYNDNNPVLLVDLFY